MANITVGGWTLSPREIPQPGRMISLARPIEFPQGEHEQMTRSSDWWVGAGDPQCDSAESV